MDSMTSEKDGASSVWSYGEYKVPILESEQGSNLGYTRQTRAELGEFWFPRRLDKSPKFGNNI